MKLWLDDVRPAPDGWVLARTVDEAIKVLQTGEVVEASLDHDLGANPEDGIYARGDGEITGLHLCIWMAAERLIPPRVNIHSWNPIGAEWMRRVLDEASKPPEMLTVLPYRV